MLSSEMLLRLVNNFNENWASSSTTALTASMFVSVVEVFGLPEGVHVPSLRHDSPLSNAFAHLRTVRKETALDP